jgi:hypothetical protein
LCFIYPDFSTFFAGVYVVMGKLAGIVFIYGLFHDAISSSDYVALRARLFINHEF